MPDVLLVQLLRESAPTPTSAQMPIAGEPLLVDYFDDERREPFIEIIYRESDDMARQ